MKYLLFITLSLHLSGGSVTAEDVEALGIVEAAEKIAAKTIKSTGTNAKIRVESFQFNGIGNIGLATEVAKQLKQSQARIALPGQAADWRLRGTIRRARGRGNVGFQISCEVIERDKDNPTATFVVHVTSQLATHENVTPTGEVLAPPDAKLTPVSKAERGAEPETVATAIVSPVIRERQRETDDPAIVETVMELAPSSRSPYAISFFGKQVGDQDYVPIPIDLPKRGYQPRIKVKMEQNIAIGIRNKSDFDAGVRVFIDGINRFATAENVKEESNMFDVVPAAEFARIEGWYKKMLGAGDDRIQDYRLFQIGKFEDSVAAQFGGKEKAGTILVTVGVAIDPESKTRIPHEFVSRAVGVKEGAPMKAAVKVVNRKLGATRAVFRVIYDVE